MEVIAVKMNYKGSILASVMVLSLLSACSTPSGQTSTSAALNPDDPIVIGSFVDTEGRNIHCTFHKRGTLFLGFSQ